MKKAQPSHLQLEWMSRGAHVGGASGRTDSPTRRGNNFAPQGEVTNVRMEGPIGGGQAGGGMRLPM